jgi:feruloyl-CoA synthase
MHDDTVHDLAPPAVLREDRPDGVFVLRSPLALQTPARCIGEWLDRWADATPEALCLAERDAEGAWRRLTYAQVRQAVGSVAQALLDLALPQGRPVVVLSDNAVDHALLMLAALYVGRPVCTVSSAYSRAQDLTKVRAILDALQPGLVYAADATVYGKAALSAGPGVPRFFSRGAAEVAGAQGFDALLHTAEGPAVRRAFESVRPDDHAKYLLTSGSTGAPKVVINTHAMLCANQEMIRQVWRFLDHEKPVVLDWLPWSHTFGGNHNLHLVLRNGGSLFIDEGRPAPGLVERTVRNLREVRPTLYFNVPRGFDMLLPFLEADDALAAEALSRMRMVFYAGAALPQSTWDRLTAVARRVRPERPLWFTTSWGSTETSPTITSAHWTLERAGNIGLPVPGMELKFVPNAGKLEMRVRGPSVFPGYRNAPQQTADAFDDEGFYRIGDAGRLLDPGRPEAGIVFDGRVAEDFKLGSGTWVSVGTLRPKLITALAPLVQDAVITGHDRDEVGALLFLSAEGRALDAEALRGALAQGLARMKAEGGGSSQCPARVLVLDEPPSADGGEITDKGYLNQRAVLQRRAAFVEALYDHPADARVVLPS